MVFNCHYFIIILKQLFINHHYFIIILKQLFINHHYFINLKHLHISCNFINVL